jgi:uncharacterized protein YdhG (YjbR/CyaY superfamily)
MTSGKSQSIDSYIATFPSEVRAILQKVRRAIRKAAPHSTETISYKIPAFTVDGRILIYFAAFKKHIGIYPPVRGDDALIKEVAPFAGPKGNLKFPLDESIPYRLIEKIVKQKLREPAAKKQAADFRRKRRNEPRGRGCDYAPFGIGRKRERNKTTNPATQSQANQSPVRV